MRIKVCPRLISPMKCRAHIFIDRTNQLKKKKSQLGSSSFRPRTSTIRRRRSRRVQLYSSSARVDAAGRWGLDAARRRGRPGLYRATSRWCPSLAVVPQRNATRLSKLPYSVPCSIYNAATPIQHFIQNWIGFQQTWLQP